MNLSKKTCPICGYDIFANNYSRHVKSCNGSYKPKQKTYHLDHDDLFCKFCHQEFRTKMSLVQHEIRCKQNPNKIETQFIGDWSSKNLKGQTKHSSKYVKKYSDSIKNLYDNNMIASKGFIKTTKYIHDQHNQLEIQKWLDYVSTKPVDIPEYQVLSKYNKSYVYISKESIKDRKLGFEHRYIANLYIDNTLTKEYCVHHIDENPQNNDIHNLMIFATASDHKRYHFSSRAWLEYDFDTHTFKCKKI